jgi:hypothetical protein
MTLRLVPYAVERVVHGFRGYVEGKLDDPQVRERAMQRMKDEYNPGQGAEPGRQGGADAKKES